MVSFSRLAALEAQGTRAVVVTVVDAKGSTPRKAGARMLVLEDGRLEGTVGGGAVEHQAVALCQEVLRTGTPRLMEVALGAELGMCCGGTMRLYLEPTQTRVPFILLGGGHVALACSRVLPGLGFSVHVADGREDFSSEARFPQADQRVDGLDARDLDALPFQETACVLIATHDHGLDQRLVELCLRRPARWLGMIGSRRKALKTRQRSLARGFSSEELRRLHCPVGLGIGAETPDEIALSIAAEMVAIRRLGSVPASGVRSMGLDLGAPHPLDALHADPGQTDDDDAPAAADDDTGT